MPDFIVETNTFDRRTVLIEYAFDKVAGTCDEILSLLSCRPMNYNVTKCRTSSRVLSWEIFWTIQKGYSLEQLWKTACVCGFSFTRWKLNNLRNPTKLILFKKAIYKTRHTRTGNEMRRMQDTQGMFTRIPVNVLEDSKEWCHFRTLTNVSREKILENVPEYPGNS